jgi:predicted Zn-dependent protease
MKRSLSPLLLAASFALPAAAGPPAHPPPDPLLQALEAELQRSWAELGKVPGPPLYFLAYEARDSASFDLSASLGTIEDESATRNRSVDVDVRVGSPRLDNTHEIKGRSGNFEFPDASYTEITTDDEPAAIRADVWLRTDDAFQDAVSRFTRVQTNKVVTAEEEDASDDFSVREPVTFYETVPLPAYDAEACRARVRELSGAMLRHPFLHRSGVDFGVDAENRYVLNSEGTRVVTGNAWVRLRFDMSSQTADGMSLQRGKSYDADRVEDLPANAAILADIEQAAAEMKALIDAPIVDPYTGPAIFRNRATGVFFHEILGHRLEGHRQKLEREGQTFTGMIGKAVVADFISVVDDPTLRAYGDQFLRGYYRFDSEGVPAARAPLITNGVLVGFLMSRTPIDGFPDSNGHGRRSAGRFAVARMANTIVEASRTVPYSRLREMLVEEIQRQGKPYGLVFDDIGGGFTTTGRGGTQSFKVVPHLVHRVYPDGRPDEIVRGVDIVGTPLASFGKIIAAADDYDVFNGNCGAESGWVPVSAVAPSILVSEIEIEKKAKSSEQPPILPLPHHDAKERP